MKRLDNKVAIVTGASSGIGRSIALRFAAEGARVVVADIHPESNAGGFEAQGQRDTVSEIEALCGVASYVRCDVTDRAQVVALVAAAVARHGALDIMVNNAGVYRSGKLFHEFTDAELDVCYEVNVRGTWYGCQEAVKAFLAAARRGCIVNIVSTAGLGGHPRQSVYNMSKAAVASLTQCVAIEYGKDGIRANGICPTLAKTSMTRGFFDDADYNKGFAESIPLKRWCEVEDVSNLALFLASEESSYIQGALVPVDGGETLCRYSVEDEL